jgi:membrane protein DedA with SNARE-associated domain
MNGLDAFLTLYGLPAIFIVLLIKAIGIPLPVPADVIMLTVSTRVAAGKFVLWQAFSVVLLALVGGEVLQFLLARGPGRKVMYRFGRYLGLTAARLDAASTRVKRAGPIGIGLIILTPGVRAASVAACGIAGVRFRTFLPGLILGEASFLSLHFFVGALIAPVLAALAQMVSPTLILAVIVLVLIAGLVAWIIIRRKQRPTATRDEVLVEAYEAWHEAACPVCLAIGAFNRLEGPARLQRDHEEHAVPN